MSTQVIVITGASSGFGAPAARALAKAGHTVYARHPRHPDPQYQGCCRRGCLRQGNRSRSAHSRTRRRQRRFRRGRHHRGHRGYRPPACRRPQCRPHVIRPGRSLHAEQFAKLYDINVLSTQRVNRAALPFMRKQGEGLVIWVSSSSTRGGMPSYLSPYFAAKAAMDSFAVS